MKILQIITSLHIGGAEKLIVDIAPILRDRGHEVEVLLLSGIETPFVNKLRSEGIVVHSLGIGSVYNPLLIFKIIPYLKRFDVVHTHLFQPQYWAAFAKFFSMNKVKLVTTEHSTNNRRREITFFRWVDRFVYRQHNAVISISDKTNKELKYYLESSDTKFSTINNGICLKSYMEASPLDKEKLVGMDGVKLIVKVAGFREAKDHETLIRSLLRLPDQVHLVLVGSGVRQSICEDLVVSLGIQDRVHFLGMRTDISRILKTADIVVMSSHWEGFGLAALEGMAAMKPVIASNVLGLADVVAGAGILFKQGDEKELAAHITKLLNDPVFYKEIADRCFKRAQQYDIEKMVDQYEEIYNK